MPGLRWRAWGWIAGGCVLAAAPLVACWGPEYHSVRFNNGRPDFFRQPRLWRHARSDNRALLEGEEPPFQPGGKNPSPASFLKRARKLEAAGQFREAAHAWRAWRSRLSDPLGWDEAGETSAAASLTDRLGALEQWRGAQDTAALRIYLRARNLVDANKPGVFQLLPALAGTPYASRSLYLQAAVHFRASEANEAAALEAASDPKETARRFAVLVKDPYVGAQSRYMVGRTYSWAALPKDEEEAALKKVDAAATEYLRVAAGQFQQAAAASKDASFSLHGVDMAGGCYYRLGEYPQALLRYCRVLGRTRAEKDPPGVFTSAKWCLNRMKPAEHQEFQRLAVAEPETAAAYLDLHLNYGTLGARGAHNLGLFALEVLKRKPAARVSGTLLTQLAALENRLGRTERAERLVRAALQRLTTGTARDEARWQLASALRGRSGPAALAEYEALAKDAALPRMRRGAHEAAAVLSERQGDRVAAVRHYFDLDYRLDFSYLLDCVMTVLELEAFLKRHPSHPKSSVVRYSLAFRRLRAGEYSRAIAEFEAVRPFTERVEKQTDTSTSRGKKRVPPLTLARELLEWERQEKRAATPDGKAKAAYAAAARLFHDRHLGLYNSALWGGNYRDNDTNSEGYTVPRQLRTWGFDMQGGPNDPNAPDKNLTQAERDRLRTYQEEHTCLWQALVRFERLARLYPRTPEAPKALYSAAVCYTLLENVDAYWAGREDLHYETRSVNLYRKLQREYPQDPLARPAGQYGGVVQELGR